MPIYKYECQKCRTQWDEVHTVDERMNEEHCGVTAIRLISPTAKPQVYNYYCEGIGAQITGPAQRAKLMKQKGLADADPL